MNKKRSSCHTQLHAACMSTLRALSMDNLLTAPLAAQSLGSHCSSLGVQLGTGSGHCLDSAMAAPGKWNGVPVGNPVYSPGQVVPELPPAADTMDEDKGIEIIKARLAVLQAQKKAKQEAAAAKAAAAEEAAKAAAAKAQAAALERQRSQQVADQALVKAPPGWLTVGQPQQPPPAAGKVAAKATQPTAF